MTHVTQTFVTSLLTVGVLTAQSVPTLVVDANPGPGSSYPTAVAEIGAVTLLWMTDVAHGRELWRTDGTTAGTFLVVDFIPGPNSTFEVPFTVANGLAFFTWHTEALGTELYVTDGTTPGFRLVRDLLPNQTSTDPAGLLTFGDRLLFTARTVGLGERELYITDGTFAGTRMVKDIRPGFPGAQPQFLTVFGNRVFFVADDGVHGAELWSTDGTEAGTQMVLDLVPGAAAGRISGLEVIGGTLFLRVGDYLAYELWRSDGSTAGTQRVAPIPNLLLRPNAVLGDKIFFSTSGGFGADNLWVTDGTAAGTLALGANFNHGLISQPWRGQLWLGRTDATTGTELWVTDGTLAGTRLFADLRPGTTSGSPARGILLGDRLVFFCNDPLAGYVELWSTDGTVAGTGLLHPRPLSGRALGSRYLWFCGYEAATGYELWRTDGAPAGTVRITDAPGYLLPDELFQCNGALLFRATTANLGVELHRLDPGATTKPLGLPCPSARWTPVLTASDPVAGGTMRLAAAGAPTVVAGLVFLGTMPQAPLPLGSCRFYPGLDPLVPFGPFPAPNAVLRADLAIPSAPELLGRSFVAQALLAPTAGLGFELSQGLVVTVGH